MTERDLTEKAHARIALDCRGAHIYKHNDRSTEGMPDASVTWNGYTSWLEYKHLEPSEDIHSRKGGTGGLKRLQLMELLALERASGGRAWVVAYRKGKRGQAERLEIYRPSALLSRVPVVCLITPALHFTSHGGMLEALRGAGCAAFETYDHHAVSFLIRSTHESLGTT